MFDAEAVMIDRIGDEQHIREEALDSRVVVMSEASHGTKIGDIARMRLNPGKAYVYYSDQGRTNRNLWNDRSKRVAFTQGGFKDGW